MSNRVITQRDGTSPDDVTGICHFTSKAEGRASFFNYLKPTKQFLPNSCSACDTLDRAATSKWFRRRDIKKEFAEDWFTS